MMSRSVLAGLIVTGAFVACDSPTGPVDHHAVVRVSLEQVVTDEVAPDDTLRRYSFVSTDSGLYGVYVQLLEGQAYLVVRDTLAGGVRASVSLVPRTGPLEAEATLPFILPGGRTSIVDIYPTPRGSTVRFRFKAHRIDDRPEHQLLNGRFTLGDTIATESLDDILDVDEFTTTGTAGQEIDVALKATGTPGTEGISLALEDPDGFFLTYTFTSAGEPGSVTGRFVLPTSGTYRFYVQAIYGAKGRYTGPFVFWTYFINRAPEHRTPALPVNTIITGEDLAPAGDADEFTLVTNSGAEFNVFLQSKRSTFVRLQAFDAGGNYVAFVDAVPADTGMFEHATGRFSSPTVQTKVVISGENDHSVTDTGAYRLFVYPVNPLPEHRAAAIAPGDTVSGEPIDIAGDVDEFTFSGSAGDEMNLAFQELPTSDVLRADIVSPGGQSIAYAEAFAPDTGLYQRVTGTFTLPVSGTYRVRVSNPNSRHGSDLGSYRFFLYRINRQPETLPATLALGDSLSGESIDIPGDIDEFTVSVPDSTGVLLAVELAAPPDGSGFVSAALVDSTGAVDGAASAGSPGGRSPSGRLRLGPGTYIVRVSGGFSFSTLRAPYRIWLYKFSWGPETVTSTFAIGDTVSGESIEPWGDADVFHFYGVAGQHVNFKFQGLNPAAGINGLVASIRRPGDIYALNASVFTQLSAASLESFQSMRLDLPVTGSYELTVAGPSHTSGQGIAEQGAYRFALVVEDSLPEHVSSSLVPGDSVGAESIDTPGDWDQFIVSATAGQDLGIVFDGKDGTTSPFPYVYALDPATDDTLAGTVGQSERFVGPFKVTGAGQVKIAVYEPAGFFRSCSDATCGGVYRFTGSYGMQVLAINRAPESASAVYVVGDTVRGEAIATNGDFDEFTASATPGEPLNLFFRMTAPPGGQPYGLTIEIIDPATGDTLAGQGAQTFGQQFWQVGSFTVPAGGSFLIRVRGTGTFGDQLTTGPYEFFIKP